MKGALAFLGCLLLAGAVQVTPAKAGAQSPLKSGTFDPPRIAPAFSLSGSDGAEVKPERFRGKVMVLGFGFTHCPEVCPTTLAKLAKVRKRLGAEARDLQVLYVTVDPERDNPGQLRAYLANFDPTFIGGTGTPAQLAQVYKDYGITATRWPTKDPAVYGFEHSSFVYLIDREGRIRAMVPYGKSADDIAHDAAILLEK
jgi:protein SCO1/2